MELTYRQFEDDDADSGYREAEAYALALQQHAITDYKVLLPRLHTPSACTLERKNWLPVYKGIDALDSL